MKISDIESRIAALSAAGLTVKPVEKARKKSNGQVSVEERGCEHRDGCLAAPSSFPAALSLTEDEMGGCFGVKQTQRPVLLLCLQAFHLCSPNPTSSPGEPLDDVKVGVCLACV